MAKKNTKEQIDEWLRAAEAGDAEAQYRIGDAYDWGNGVEQDFAAAKEWYRKAAKQGHALAQNAYGEVFYYGRRYGTDDEPQALVWFRKAAEQGVPAAYYNIGACYNNGCGVALDKDKALEYYLKAAMMGDSEALLNFGIDFLRGNYGYEQNVELGIKLLEISAESGNWRAQYNLANHFMDTNEPAKAMKWYRRSAEEGHDKSQFIIADALYFGKDGVEQDYEEAAKWFKEAAEQGYSEAQYALGTCYYYGHGVPQDMDMAQKLHDFSVYDNRSMFYSVELIKPYVCN